MQMPFKHEGLMTEYKEVFEKILEAVKREYPKASKKEISNIAMARTETWVDFLSSKEIDMPLLSLFKDLNEIYNLKIEAVRVEYPTEPLIILECKFQGVRRYSHLTYSEALREVEFATKNNVIGADKLRNIMERLEMEMIDVRKVRKVGNSLVVTVPESISSLFSLNDGDYLSFVYRFGEVKVKKF